MYIYISEKYRKISKYTEQYRTICKHMETYSAFGKYAIIWEYIEKN